MENLRYSKKRRKPERRNMCSTQIETEISSKTGQTYKKASLFIWGLMLFRLLDGCGLITWRTERAHHLLYVFKTIKTSLDDDQILDGVTAVAQEFIIDLVNLGGWIEFVFMATILFFGLKYLPDAVKWICSFINRHEDTISTVFSSGASVVKNISSGEIASEVESVMKFGVVGLKDKAENRTVGISMIIDGVYYCGGVAVKNCVKVKRLRMISMDGDEIIHQLAKSITIVAGMERVFICGRFTDQNDTVQRRKALSTEPEDIMIGKLKYCVSISY